MLSAFSIGLSLVMVASTPIGKIDELPALVDVFSGGTDGYACYRIPALLRINNSTLILFAEGRLFDCNDHGFVDIVSKTSSDGGKTWGPLLVVHSESSLGHRNVTIGNAAPVLLGSGRILVPFCRNNLEAGVLFSDDTGQHWATLSNMSIPSSWTWVATGPPGSLELTGSGRIIVPANHEDASGRYSHAFLSDDGGTSWSLSSFVTGGNEDQAASLTWVSPMVRVRAVQSYRFLSRCPNVNLQPLTSDCPT